MSEQLSSASVSTWFLELVDPPQLQEREARRENRERLMDERRTVKKESKTKDNGSSIIRYAVNRGDRVSKCQHCSQIVDKKILRICKIVVNIAQVGKRQKQRKHFYHTKCWMQSMERNVAGIPPLGGWNKLSSQEQEEVKKMNQDVASERGGQTNREKNEAAAHNKLDTFAEARNTLRMYAEDEDKTKYFRALILSDEFDGDLALWLKFILPNESKEPAELTDTQLYYCFGQLLKMKVENVKRLVTDGNDMAVVLAELNADRRTNPTSTWTIFSMDKFLINFTKAKSHDERMILLKTATEELSTQEMELLIILIRKVRDAELDSKVILDGLGNGAFEEFEKVKNFEAVVEMFYDGKFDEKGKMEDKDLTSKKIFQTSFIFSRQMKKTDAKSPPIDIIPKQLLKRKQDAIAQKQRAEISYNSFFKEKYPSNTCVLTSTPKRKIMTTSPDLDFGLSSVNNQESDTQQFTGSPESAVKCRKVSEAANTGLPAPALNKSGNGTVAAEAEQIEPNREHRDASPKETEPKTTSPPRSSRKNISLSFSLSISDV